MSDAPERIWLGRAWANTFATQTDPVQNEYIRADLCITLDQANVKLALHESENVTRGLLLDKLEAQLQIVQSSLMNAQDQANAMVGAALREAAEIVTSHNGAPCVPPMSWDDAEQEGYVNGQMDASRSWVLSILALAPTAPPDVAQAARVLLAHVQTNCGTEVDEWVPVLSAICARTGGSLSAAMNGLVAALRALLPEGGDA